MAPQTTQAQIVGARSHNRRNTPPVSSEGSGEPLFPVLQQVAGPCLLSALAETGLYVAKHSRASFPGSNTLSSVVMQNYVVLRFAVAICVPACSPQRLSTRDAASSRSCPRFAYAATQQERLGVLLCMLFSDAHSYCSDPPSFNLRRPQVVAPICTNVRVFRTLFCTSTKKRHALSSCHGSKPAAGPLLPL